MKKIVSIVGARPQFIKACPLSVELRQHWREILVHTGQHYDYGMSGLFFRELALPAPDYNLGVGSGTHSEQTAAMLAAVEKVLLKEDPTLVIVFGDTNSTLAGALAAVKLHVPVAHVEAGMRSFNRLMPEEINRLVTDHISQWLFPPSEVARQNLENEGIRDHVFVVGDIMCDAVKMFRERARRTSEILDTLGLHTGGYCLATIHRAGNTDNSHILRLIFESFAQLEKEVIMPVHPRTRKNLEQEGLEVAANIKLIDAVGYLDMIQLMQHADCIMTDSGGLQKEAYYLGVPCVTLRDETEWTETVETGWNVLVGSSAEKLIEAVKRGPHVRQLPRKNLYGNGKTAKRIVEVLSESL